VQRGRADRRLHAADRVDGHRCAHRLGDDAARDAGRKDTMPAQIDSAISPAERAPDLAAEPAADVGCDDADAVLGDAEDPRVQQPGRVRGLRRRLHGELAADRVVLSRCSLSRSCSLGPPHRKMIQ
jgi:hypothetical protein